MTLFPFFLRFFFLPNVSTCAALSAVNSHPCCGSPGPQARPWLVGCPALRAVSTQPRNPGALSSLLCRTSLLGASARTYLLPQPSAGFPRVQEVTLDGPRLRVLGSGSGTLMGSERCALMIFAAIGDLFPVLHPGPCTHAGRGPSMPGGTRPTGCRSASWLELPSPYKG